MSSPAAAGPDAAGWTGEGQARSGASLAGDLTDAVALAVLEAAPDGVLVVEASGVVRLANRQAEAMFGWPRGELVGEPIEVLLPTRLRDAHVNHRTSYVREPRVRPMGVGLELRGRRRDGTELPVEIALSPLAVGDEVFTIATVRDITERMEMQEQTRRVRGVLDAITDEVVIFDGDTLEILYVNHTAAAAAGLPREALLAGTVPDLGAHFAPRMLRPRVEPLMRGARLATAYEEAVARNGERRTVEVVLQRPFDDVSESPGTDRWLVAVVRDVTDRSRAEEALLATRKDLAVSGERERIARDLHDTVIQQLFAIGMSLQAITPRVQVPDVAERIRATVDGLDATISDIRTAIFGLQSRPEWGRGVRGEVLRAAADAGRMLGFEPRVHFSGDLDALPDVVAGHLLSVIRETLSNAARHARAANVDVHVEAHQHGSGRGELLVRAVDDGVGLGGAQQPVAGRLDAAGGGNGLRNLRERARQLDGDLVIEPSPGGGTTVVWRVPFVVRSASASPLLPDQQDTSGLT